MPVKLSVVEHLGLQVLNRGPGPMLDCMGALGFRIVALAVKLGIFRELGAAPLEAGTVAARLGLDKRGADLLMQALEALGYVALRGDVYRPTAMTRRWMLDSSPSSMSGMFGYFTDMLDRWQALEDTVRTGKPMPALGAWFSNRPGGWDRYHEGMRSIARLVGPDIVRRVRISQNARRLLDLGGSHGLYSILFCRKHPGLSAEILDWPEAQPVALKTIAGEGIANRVSFHAGDFVKDSVQGPYDVVLMFNFIRVFQPEQLLEVLRKARGIMSPGGQVVVMDQFGPARPTRFTTANHLLVSMELLGSTRGRTYRAQEASDLLTRAGFAQPRIAGLRRSAGLGLVTAHA